MRRLRMHNPVATAAMLIAFACIVVMAVFIIDDSRDDREQKKALTKAQDAIDLILEQRDEARLSACLSYNEDLVAFLNGLNDEVQDLAIDAFADPTGRRTPAQAKEVAEFLATKVAAFELRKVPTRDCSRQGIEDFYARRDAKREADRAQPDGAVGEPFPTTTTTGIRRAATTTTARPTTTTGRSTTSTTYHSSPTPSDPVCEVLPGLTVPREIPC